VIVAIASGKGGTGKTTLSVNLAKMLAPNVQLLDCDVEAPNCHLFLEGEVHERIIVNRLVPHIDETRCNACGECARFCAFHAIAMLGTVPLVFPEMCHECGGCVKVCPVKAIKEKGQPIGVIEKRQSQGVPLVQGRLDIGVAMAPPLIRAVKACINKETTVIIDAPPGTSCPVLATVRDADFTVLVTEPTPFGLNDLALAVGMVRALGVPFGVVINRTGIGDARVHDYCRAQDIPILLEIPDDRRIAEAYSRGIAVIDAVPEMREHFLNLFNKIRQTI